MSDLNEKSEIQFVDEKAESVAEKPHQIVQIDNFSVLGLSTEDAEFYINYPTEKRKKVIHKVDPPFFREIFACCDFNKDPGRHSPCSNACSLVSGFAY
jgi:hypothetical protein